MEYKAVLTSPIISGDVSLIVGEDGLVVNSVFDTVEINYAEILSIAVIDYAVQIITYSGDFSFSRMGNWCEPFCKEVLDAYNKKVLKSLFISGTPSITAKGDYSYTEDSLNNSGKAEFFLYENCLCFLTPDTKARRIPLCFLTGMEVKDFEITFLLDEQKYTIAKIGYDTEPVHNEVKTKISALREKSINALSEIDVNLTSMQLSSLAKIMPEGAAAKLSKLNEIAPTLVNSLEEKIDSGRAAETYKVFCEICDKSQIYIGFKKNAISSEAEEDQDPYTLWFIVPSPDGKSCAVEFAGEVGTSAATFIYRFDTDFDSFARKLNIALEAIDFKREVIRLSDEELMRPENADYLMAFQRNRSLQFVRSCFVGRVIHRSVDSWKNSILDYFGQ